VRIAGSLASVALALLVVGSLGGRAAAEPAVDPKIAKADELFTEGRALLASNLLQACAKFVESLQYNPAAIGTLLNVALCDEKLGRVASAVAKFSEARDRAKEQGLSEHVRAAEEHILALEPSIPHVAITLTEQLPETTILIDDALVAQDAIANVPVDPGERVIVVSAPARLPYRTKLVFAPGEHKDLTIPALARSVTVKSSQRRIGQIATAVGGLAIGAGIWIGVTASHLYYQQFHDLDAFGNHPCTHTPQGPRCTLDGQTQTEKARTRGNFGTGFAVTGLVIASAGAILWLRAPAGNAPPDTSDYKLTVVPQLAPDGLGVVALGRF
jgi:hypothetical protein